MGSLPLGLVGEGPLGLVGREPLGLALAEPLGLAERESLGLGVAELEGLSSLSAPYLFLLTSCAEKELYFRNNRLPGLLVDNVFVLLDLLEIPVLEFVSVTF